MGTFDDNRRHHRELTESFRRIDFALDHRGDIGLLRESSGSRSFRPICALQQDCYGPATSRCLDSSNDFTRALNYRRSLSVSRDWTRHARPCHGPRGPAAQHSPAFALPGFAIGSTLRTTRSSWHDFLRNRYQRHRSVDAAHNRPSVFGWRKSASPSRTSRPGCAPTIFFRIANQRGNRTGHRGTCRAGTAGWSTYGVGDQMSHYSVNAGIARR